MSNFIDDEASEVSSSDEEVMSETVNKTSSKQSKKSSKSVKKSKEIIDSSEDEDDEDDEEGADDVRDLINDEEEEEEADDSEDSDAGNKRSHDDDDNSSLDSDDLDLINEAGIKVQKRKKFKRIRQISDDESDQEADAGKAIAKEIFGGGAGLLDSDDEQVTRSRSRPTDQDLEFNSEEEDDVSDENDFIVDDDDQPVSRRKKKGSSRYTDSAMQRAQEVFGVDFDFDDIEEGEDGYDDMDDYNADYDEDEEATARTKRKTKVGRKSIYEVYEPAELERSHLTHADQHIKTRDIPERFQLRSVPVEKGDDEELNNEAKWIFDQAFNQNTISIQERNNEPIAGKRPEIIVQEIEYALRCIRNEKLEIPFISAYRREYVSTISSSFDDTKDLWTIYKYDEKWYHLQQNKKSVIKLYEDLKEYLSTQPADSRIRNITDEDTERVLKCKTFYEINDCRLHLKLYYSSFINPMKLKQLEKKLDEIKETKNSKKKAQSPNASPKENGNDAKNDDEEDDVADKADGEDNAVGDDDENNGEDDDEDDEEQQIIKKLKQVRVSSSRDTYQKCREDYIGSFVEKFGLSAQALGENLRDDYQRNNVKHNPTRPIEEAALHLKPGIRFHTREDILKAAKYMFSREISCDPLVRQTVRRFFFDTAVIQVKPTDLGLKEIDESHPCYSLKFLRNKPVAKLADDQFLHIKAAEELKLLEVKFDIEPIDSDRNRMLSPYYESLKALYFSDFSSLVTKEWNEQREEAVRAALDKYLLPCFEKELREKLTREAQEKIIKTCSEKLHELLNVAPFIPPETFDGYEDYELRNGTRICGFSFAPEGDAPCFAAVVDSEGELLGHARFPYLNIRKRQDRMSAMEKENQAKDRAKFKQFIMSKKPHVIALAADTIQTQYIFQDLLSLVTELQDHDGLPETFIEVVDNELATFVKHLKKTTDEFPEFPPLLLQAISNARKLNEPLVEYAKLCTPDNDILCLRFHPLQDDVPKEELLESLLHQFITRTNAVGVDVNRTIEHQHTTDVMQFLAGLGPRKAFHLLRSIRKSSTTRLVSRQQLVSELGMTSTIFMNCSGFIKLDTDFLADNYPEEHVTPLDSTRIHPESYIWAKKIASDALDYDEGAPEEDTANAIDEILDNPEKLDDLDLGAFAKELDEVQKKGKKAFTLQSIRDELVHRYKDFRELYKQPSHEEVFQMLTKETPHTFYQGKLVTCQVTGIPRKKPPTNKLDMANPTRIDETNLWRCPFCLRSDFQDLSLVWNHFDANDCPGFAIGLRVKLDNGLSGFIHNKNISDKEIANPEERVQIGQTIHARVIKIDSHKFSCELTCRSSDLLDRENKLKPRKDDYYDHEAEEFVKRELEAKNRKASRRPYTKRMIVHPAFQNIDYKACEKKLAEMEQGAYIIRPSSMGPSYLTVSWKIANGIHHHVNIREEGKENPFSLGNQLFIENEAYEDLDEIIARHIQPMASFARDILNYKHCILAHGNEQDELRKVVMTEKQKNPASIPYRFCPSKVAPGKFVLAYAPGRNPRFEYLTITPSGYRYRKLYFKSLAYLIKWFKENYSKPTHMTPALGYETASVRQTFPISQ